MTHNDNGLQTRRFILGIILMIMGGLTLSVHLQEMRSVIWIPDFYNFFSLSWSLFAMIVGLVKIVQTA